MRNRYPVMPMKLIRGDDPAHVMLYGQDGSAHVARTDQRSNDGPLLARTMKFACDLAKLQAREASVCSRY